MAPFEKYRVANLNFPIYNFDHRFDIEFYLELEYFVKSLMVFSAQKCKKNQQCTENKEQNESHSS